jgi:hypothetical protein
MLPDAVTSAVLLFAAAAEFCSVSPPLAIATRAAAVMPACQRAPCCRKRRQRASAFSSPPPVASAAAAMSAARLPLIDIIIAATPF